MKKFQFPLQKILEYKIHVQKKEKDTLKAMQLEYNLLEEHMKELKKSYEQYKNEYLSKASKGMPVRELVMLCTYITEIQKKIKALQAEMEEAKEKIDRQIDVLLAVTREKTTIEKLKEQKLFEYSEEERKKEEKFIDELVANSASA